MQIQPGHCYHHNWASLNLFLSVVWYKHSTECVGADSDLAIVAKAWRIAHWESSLVSQALQVEAKVRLSC